MATVTRLEIERVLVLSTSHLREEIAEMLPNTHEDEPSTIEQAHWWPSFTRAEGWMFHIPSDREDMRYIDAPEELKTLVALARANGCTWLMLDRDGPVVDELPHWEW